MRKYCQLANLGDPNGLMRVINPISVPDSITDVPTWLTMMFPQFQSGSFVPADESISSGATAMPGADLTNVANFTNPPNNTVVVYQDLSEIGFIMLCQEAGGMTDDMLVACQSDEKCAAMWIKFKAATVLSQNNPLVQNGITDLDNYGYLPNHAAAVNAAWPTQ